MNLRERVVVITGGRRIGQVVAWELASRGADIVLSYRGSKTAAEEAAAEVRRRGRTATVVQADVTRPADCAALMRAADSAHGRLDVVVNMASVYSSAPFEHLTEAEWDRDLAANLKSAFLCSQAAVPLMRQGGGGRIVNFADWLAASGRPGYQGFAAYYVAKAAIIALTEALALELAADQILVNAIAPGPIVAPPDLSEAELREVAAETPLGRWGGELEIAKAVVALIETNFMTGETIRVDGGRHVR
jgi:3-oxoacyl-[acyl-carrier protein] reductase